MATVISRRIRDINEEVTKLNRSIKEVTKDNRQLNRSLRLDPTNMTLLTQKTENLEKAVGFATQKVAALKRAQVEMQAAVKAGETTAEEYRELTREIAKAEIQLKSFNAELLKTSTAKLEDLQNKLSGFSRGALAAIGAITALGVAFANAGDEIADMSERYRISAEEFQRNRFIFDRATANAQSYSQTLENLTRQMASLARGSSRAVNSFAALGLAQEDIANKSPAEVLELIIDRLRTIADVEEQAALATMLLGAQGVEVAQVAQLTAEEIAALNAELEKAGIMTSEEVEQAADLKDRMDDVKLSIQKAAAELSVALIPAFELLTQIANMAAPILRTLAGIFNAIPAPLQRLGVLILLFLAILPKLISFIVALNKALLLLSANPVAIKIMLIVAAVAALIYMLYKLGQLLGIFDKKRSFEFDASINTPDGGATSFGSYVPSTAAAGAASTTTHVTHYYDYSTINNTIEKEADIDDIAEQLSTKIKVGGAR